MNIDTWELMKLKPEENPPEGFTPVPDEYEDEARKELGDADSVTVDKTRNTPLVNWAKEKAKAKRKARAKMAKTSRRKNR